MLCKWFIYIAFTVVTSLLLLSLKRHDFPKSAPLLERAQEFLVSLARRIGTEQTLTRVGNRRDKNYASKQPARTNKRLHNPDGLIQSSKPPKNTLLSRSEPNSCPHCEALGRQHLHLDAFAKSSVHSQQSHAEVLAQIQKYELRQQESDQTIRALTRKIKLMEAEMRGPAITRDAHPLPDQQLTAPYPPTALEAAFERWQRFDPSDDFTSLDSSISSLASSLHRHANTSAFSRHRYQALSDTYALIKGVPYEKWTRERPLLFRGVIWTILLGSIFSNDFAVFGERSLHLTKEWCGTESDYESATWRMLTAKKLLIKAGIVQIHVDGSDNPSNSLEQLLIKSHTISKSIGLITLQLRTSNYKVLTNKMVLARQHAESLFEPSDELARDSLNEARDGFVYELTTFIEQFTGRDALTMQVLQVITKAQMLALRIASHGGCHHFIVPDLGSMYQQANVQGAPPIVSRVRCCSQMGDGKILFTVRPGLRLVRDPHILEAEARHPALVYLDGNDEHPYSTVSLDDIPEQSAIWSNPFAPAEEPTLEDAAENPLRDLPTGSSATIAIKADELYNDFIDISRAIRSQTGSLSLKPEGTVASLLPQHMIFCSDPTSSLSKPTYVEAAIWGILFKAVFKHPFAAFGDAGSTFFETWSALYRSVEQTSSRYMTEANNWRFSTATQLLDRIGGEAILKPPHRSMPVDHQLFNALRDYQTLVAKQIKKLLSSISHDPVLDGVEVIVQKASLLSLKMSLTKSHVELWHPPSSVPYNAPRRGQKASVEVAGECPGQEGGRVTVIIQPGLRQYGDEHGRHLQTEVCLVPALVHLADGPKVAPPQPSATPAPDPPPHKLRFAFVEDCDEDDDL